MALDWVQPGLVCCYLLLFLPHFNMSGILGQIGSCGWTSFNPGLCRADLSRQHLPHSKNTWSNILSISVFGFYAIGLAIYDWNPETPTRSRGYLHLLKYWLFLWHSGIIILDLGADFFPCSVTKNMDSNAMWVYCMPHVVWSLLLLGVGCQRCEYTPPDRIFSQLAPQLLANYYEFFGAQCIFRIQMGVFLFSQISTYLSGTFSMQELKAWFNQWNTYNSAWFVAGVHSHHIGFKIRWPG